MGETTGEVETEEGVLVIRRIHVVYRLRVPAGIDRELREKIEKLHALHHRKCPVYRSLHRAIDLTTELVLEQE